MKGTLAGGGGVHYTGMWQNDVRCGAGVEVIADGTRWEGTWDANGRKNGKFLEVDSNGNRYEVGAPATFFFFFFLFFFSFSHALLHFFYRM